MVTDTHQADRHHLVPSPDAACMWSISIRSMQSNSLGYEDQLSTLLQQCWKSRCHASLSALPPMKGLQSAGTAHCQLCRCNNICMMTGLQNTNLLGSCGHWGMWAAWVTWGTQPWQAQAPGSTSALGSSWAWSWAPAGLLLLHQRLQMALLILLVCWGLAAVEMLVSGQGSWASWGYQLGLSLQVHPVRIKVP